MTAPGEQGVERQVGSLEVIMKGPVWVLPLVAGSVLVLLMTLLYFGSIVDPGSHLRGLPLSVVDGDNGANTPAGHVDARQKVVAGLTGAQAVTSRLALEKMTLTAAEARMNKGAAFATVVIPSGFTASLLAVAGNPVSTRQAVALPAIELLTNSRAGTLRVSLATGVMQPAVAPLS
jgi:hypothetical protein